MTARVLVAGIGNVFFTDDGFGSETARRLLGVALPPEVKVVDYGIRGMHLAYDLLDGYEALVIIDAVPRAGAAGDIVVLEVTEEDLANGEFDPHGMQPTAVLGNLGVLGGELPRTFVVGCEPADVEEGLGLTPVVRAAVDRAVTVVLEVLEEQLHLSVPSTDTVSAEGSTARNAPSTPERERASWLS